MRQKVRVPGKLFAEKLKQQIKQKQKASAAAEVMPLSRTSSWPEVSCSTVPACLRAVENLDSPQHDDDGRYQRGRRQYTF
jgi:hypothetical protein